MGGRGGQAASSLSDSESIRLALHVIILLYATDNDNTQLDKSGEIQTASLVYYQQLGVSPRCLQVPLCIFLLFLFSYLHKQRRLQITLWFVSDCYVQTVYFPLRALCRSTFCTICPLVCSAVPMRRRDSNWRLAVQHMRRVCQASHKTSARHVFHLSH